ncbi:hypothetical protein CW310_26180 [Pseudomonas citronellolis]|nr:hypothetical protein CW310_26180 [Pseudomonas citronellolis]
MQPPQGWEKTVRLATLRACSRSRELEQNKAKTGEEAQFSPLNEHYSPVFNAVMPTRSRS